jgi:hypothetical protein
MSFPSPWGPYPFSISDNIQRYITLTESDNSCPNAPSGTTPFTVSIEREDTESGFTERGTVMLDDDGVIKAFCNPNKRKSWGYTLTNMVGQFNLEGGSTSGTWKGDSTTETDGGPTGTEGVWQAGGTDEPFPQHDHKRAHA